MPFFVSSLRLCAFAGDSFVLTDIYQDVELNLTPIPLSFQTDIGMIYTRARSRHLRFNISDRTEKHA
jgi:hypothetical protein